MPEARHVRLFRWTGDDLPPQPPLASTRRYTDPFGQPAVPPEREYEQSVWCSPVTEVGFDASSAIASWNASTPAGTWIEVEVRENPATPWLVMARWAESDDEIHRTTVKEQTLDGASVATDEIRVDPGSAWRTAQVRVTRLRRVGSAHWPTPHWPTPQWPTLRSVSLAVAGERTVFESEPSGVAHAIEVPAYSQQMHRDENPDFGGGGQNWCSPTAVSMVLAHWDAGPEDRPVVPYAATQTYDHSYAGAGNWAFNAAYAGRFGVDAFVTRLRTLAEAESFTRAGIPLVVSVVFKRDQLDGAGYDTAGHLLVLVGFDAAGNPVVNDPASHKIRSNNAVRTTYRRDQFEQSWLVRSSGIAYVIRPEHVPLPPRPAEANW